MHPAPPQLGGLIEARKLVLPTYLLFGEIFKQMALPSDRFCTDAWSAVLLVSRLELRIKTFRQACSCSSTSKHILYACPRD